MTTPNRNRELCEALWRALAPAVPRLLTQMERDPDSPLYGCFDRDHWHYKIRDFASAILQQGVVSLDALAALDLPGNSLFALPRMEDFSRAALRCFARLQRFSGGYDEYYPREQGFPPAAFGCYAAGLYFFRRGWPEPEPEVRAALQRGVDWLLRRQETEALNQECAALAGLTLAGSIPGLRVDQERLARRWDAFYAAQAPGGWFPEYGGPDTGYLSVTLDCLFDAHCVSGDPRALEAMRRAVGFIAELVLPDGRIPAMANARNTDYIAPYGLMRLGATDPVAAAVVHALFEHADAPGHFLHATDDRYLCHYLFQSAFRSLEHMDQLMEPCELPRDRAFERFDREARLYVRHGGKRGDGRSVIFAGAKGGVCYLVGPDGVEDADFGWRATLPGGKLAVTHWPSPDWRVSREEKGDAVCLCCSGPVRVQGFTASTPLRHAVLRLLSLLCGPRLIPALKRRLIFRAAGLPVTFQRRLVLTPEARRIEDRFEGIGVGKLSVRPAPEQSLRHVASASRFCPEELLPEPTFELRSSPGRVLAVRALGSGR